MCNYFYELTRRIGQHPIHILKDVPGFIGNRMQHALWLEMFAIIDQCICKPRAINEIIRNEIGLRLSFLGPVENTDMVGLDLTLNIHNYILNYLDNKPIPSRTL